MEKRGRPQEIDIQEIKRLRSLGYTFSRIAQKLNYSRQGIIKAFKKEKTKGDVGVGI